MLHIKNLSEDLLKSIEDHRVPDIPMANHDAPLDEVFKEYMLMQAKESGSLIDFSKGEWKSDDES